MELRHPSTDLRVRVPEADADRWIAVGWIGPSLVADEPADDNTNYVTDTDDAAEPESTTN